MITCIFPPSNRERDAQRQYLAELRDERLKRAGCTVEQRVAYTAQHIATLTRKS